jgi:hypothetical protein
MARPQMARFAKIEKCLADRLSQWLNNFLYSGMKRQWEGQVLCRGQAIPASHASADTRSEDLGFPSPERSRRGSARSLSTKVGKSLFPSRDRSLFEERSKSGRIAELIRQPIRGHSQKVVRLRRDGQVDQTGEIQCCDHISMKHQESKMKTELIQ